MQMKLWGSMVFETDFPNSFSVALSFEIPQREEAVCFHWDSENCYQLPPPMPDTSAQVDTCPWPPWSLPHPLAVKCQACHLCITIAHGLYALPARYTNVS